MGANSEKIVFCVKLPNQLYRRFHEVTQMIGETKAAFCRKCLQSAIRRALKASRENA